MLHSLEMPSFLAEDAIPPSVNGSGPTTKRSSVERHRSSIPTPKEDDGRPNGMLTNGILDGMHSLPNGHRTSQESTRRRSAGSRGTPVESLSKRNSRVTLEKERLEDRLVPERLATRDDGYFAVADMAHTEEGCFGTQHVTLSTVNGNTVKETDETVPRESTILQGNTIYTEPEKATAADRAPESRGADGSLRVPIQGHRISSPPAFQNQPAQVLVAPQPGRLQHRHTLEVPRVSTSRLSRETTASIAADEVISATGRFSPATPTRRRGSLTLVRRVTRSINSDMHLDDVPQDPDAAQYAEMVRQKRMSRKKRKEEEEEDRVLVGTKVDQNHANYVMAYNMLTGIRFTVSRTNAKMDRDLTDADFDARHKFSFDVMGAELTPSAKYDFKFKDYSPWVFRHLRSIFKIDPADYLMSLTSKYILSELGSPGKSGSFFYFSRDYKYIIKTIHHAEHKVLRGMLREYYNHVRDNPNTLLSQFYGLHRVKIPFGRKVHFVVMNNLFPPHRDIHKTFDLKGSTVGRMFKEENLKENPRATLKDLNWLNKDNHLEFGPRKKSAFIEQMQKDVRLLQTMKIMDYSLLVGIHDLKKGNEEQLREKTLQVFQPGGDKEEAHQQTSNLLARTPSKLETARKAKELRQTLRHEKPIPMSQIGSKMPEEIEGEMRRDHYFYQDDGGFRASHEDDTPGDEIYYLGIIDCLTHYGFVKRIEHFWKSLGNVESQISPIPPERYGDRFVRFISGITKSPELAAMEKADKERSTEEDAITPDQTNNDEDRARLQRSPTDQVMEKAERQMERSRDDLFDEGRVPDRQLTTARSPSAERGDPGGFTLPVVEEAVENQSTGGRSGRSDNPTPSPQLRPQMDSHFGRGQKPPPTPPKDSKDGSVDERHEPRGRPLTPLSERKIRREDLEKELPPPPPGEVSAI